jgi:hypothetical protein
VLTPEVREGRVLVVDEADKAPLEVVSILKGLVEDSEMLLSDGRRIVPSGSPSAPDTIPMHPGFRAIVLANRPGYPFLGNDFFSVCGDCFSWYKLNSCWLMFTSHPIDNPDEESEIFLLQQYAPSVTPDTLRNLTGAPSLVAN